MSNFEKDNRNNRLRKTNHDGKSHRHGNDVLFMEKHLVSLQKSQASVAKNIEGLKKKEQAGILTVDEFYKLVEWNKKAGNLQETENNLINQLYH